MAATLGGTPTGFAAETVAGISVSHTAAGTDRAAWIAVGVSAGAPNNITGATYDSNAATAAYAQLNGGSFHRQRSFYIAGDGSISTSSVTVAATFAGSNDEATISVISARGVDSGTPVGTAFTSTSTTQTPSVTVTDAGADDFVVDGIYAGGDIFIASSGPGANQTLGTENDFPAFGDYGAASYQDGADGGVMSWALTTTPSFASLIGAIAFKPLAITAAITGTATATIDETDVVAGGKTIIITLTGDTWIAN